MLKLMKLMKTEQNSELKIIKFESTRDVKVEVDKLDYHKINNRL